MLCAAAPGGAPESILATTAGGAAMIIDMHSHYIPLAAVAAAGADVATVERQCDGRYTFRAVGQSLTLDPQLFELERQRADLRNSGLDRRTMMLPPFALLYELPALAGRRWARAVNDTTAAVAARHAGEFVGFATVPLQDVPAAVAELDRAIGTLGLRGVEIATNIAGVELDDPALEPFWSLAARLRVPILVHPHAVAGANRMGDYYFRNLIGNPVETALAGARLLFGGVIERHPDLRIILAHGGGALPQLVGRLQHGYGVRPEARNRASDPLAGIGKLYYDTIVFDHPALRHLAAVAGADQVVLGTDYPFDMAEDAPLPFVRESGLPADAIARILDSGERLIAAVAAGRGGEG
jgi:aminocarboxymuconate-semialdehyde decarboxylase